MNYKFSLHELISTAESHILFICKDTNDLEFQFNQIQCQYQRAIMETRHPSCSFTLVVFQTHSSSKLLHISQWSLQDNQNCTPIEEQWCQKEERHGHTNTHVRSEPQQRRTHCEDRPLHTLIASWRENAKSSLLAELCWRNLSHIVRSRSLGM